MVHNAILMRMCLISPVAKRARKRCIPSKVTMCPFAPHVAGLVGSLRKQKHPTR